MYGHSSEWENPIGNVNDSGGYENDVFAINPFWIDPFCTNTENEVENRKANFIYKPTGFEIRWYWCPFRFACMNMKLSKRMIRKVFRSCLESIR